MSGVWYPISTAPRDGTKILLAKIVGHPAQPSALWWAASGYWSEQFQNWNDGVEFAGLAHPTHWQPIYPLRLEPTEESDMTDEIHPKPEEFTADQITTDPILRFFHYAHLPASLQIRSKPFCDLARILVETTPRNPERTVALRKLLEAKDAAVRAAIG